MSDTGISCKYDMLGLPVRNEDVYVGVLPNGDTSIGVGFSSIDLSPEMAVRLAYALLHFSIGSGASAVVGEDTE
jgi:hypothetical protein